MDKKSVAKAGAGGLGAVLIAVSVILSGLGVTTEVNGRYTIINTTSQSVEFVAEDIENVPDSTFYDLVFNNGEGDIVIGRSNYGSGQGIVTANIIMKPVENLSVVVYDQNLEAIGVGKVKENGQITYEFKKGLVTDDKSKEQSN